MWNGLGIPVTKMHLTRSKREDTKTPVLTYFNPMSEDVIQTDASLKGLGAVLLQEGRPVIYVSLNSHSC